MQAIKLNEKSTFKEIRSQLAPHGLSLEEVQVSGNTLYIIRDHGKGAWLFKGLVKCAEHVNKLNRLV